eukprot:TRINITY_DN112867_c0_g1_i1.p2 TRINITY_DN112867_c0_g1~~TRINITY_DN112867_c0_g1_i1.p2  ORF type:complete len:174 (+),score=26.90 TRINITY_DN112867_c0_g1_i1:45-566(+)
MDTSNFSEEQLTLWASHLQRLKDNDPTFTETTHFPLDAVPGGVDAWCDALKSNTHLKTLVAAVQMWEDTDAELAKILAALAGNTTLEDLELFDNPLGNDGAQKLAELFPELPALKSLGLRECSIGEEGAIALATAAGAHPSLTKIDLECNEFDPNNGPPTRHSSTQSKSGAAC